MEYEESEWSPAFPPLSVWFPWGPKYVCRQQTGGEGTGGRGLQSYRDKKGEAGGGGTGGRDG